MSDTIKKYFEDKENHEFMEKHFYKGDMWAKYKVPPPNVNQNLLAQAQPKGDGIMQNLSASERALLDPLEQVIATRT